MDGDMSKHHVAVTAALMACATLMLSACGADDGTSGGSVQGNATNNASANTEPNAVANAATSTASSTANNALISSALPNNASNTTPAAYGASAASATGPDLAVQSVEASLAADSQQVAPVLHYAPGDSDASNQGGSNN
jgi:hypothetical protein